eukprot:1680686-Ditylum_brightwellii.AAC.1
MKLKMKNLEDGEVNVKNENCNNDGSMSYSSAYSKETSAMSVSSVYTMKILSTRSIKIINLKQMDEEEEMQKKHQILIITHKN